MFLAKPPSQVSPQWSPQAELRFHRFWCGLSQTGKTAAIQNLLCQKYLREKEFCEAHGIEPPFTNITIIDPKASQWLGYETKPDLDGRSCVVHVDPSCPETFQAAYRKIMFFFLEVLPKRRRVRQYNNWHRLPYNPRPHILLIEEWPFTLQIAAAYDALFDLKGNKSSVVRICDAVWGMVETGLEDGIEVWLTTQDPTVGTNHLPSAALRANFAFYCFGSPLRGWESIRIALDGRYGIVRNPKARAKLLEQLDRFEAAKAWVTFTLSGNKELGIPYQARLGRTPLIGPEIKQTRLINGPLVPEFLKLKPVEASDGSITDEQPESDSCLSPVPVAHPATNILPFSRNQRWPSKEARRLLDFTDKQGGQLKSLRDAYVGMGASAREIRQWAQECVDLGFARMVPNKYPGSFRFVLTGVHNSDLEASEGIELPNS
jgi:hypothetical protein